MHSIDDFTRGVIITLAETDEIDLHSGLNHRFGGSARPRIRGIIWYRTTTARFPARGSLKADVGESFRSDILKEGCAKEQVASSSSVRALL